MTTTTTLSDCVLCGAPVERPDDTPLPWACQSCQERAGRRPAGITSTPLDKSCPQCGQMTRRLGVGYPGFAPFRCERCSRHWWSSEMSGAARRTFRSETGDWHPADRLYLDRCIALEAAG